MSDITDQVTVSFAVSLRGNYRRDVKMSREEYDRISELERREFNRAIEDLIEWRDIDDVEMDDCWDWVLLKENGGEQ